MSQDHRNMKTFRGFSLKPDVGLGLQNHFQRKNTQEPARYSKWGGFKDLDWDFLDREFYSKGGKKCTESQDNDKEMVLEEKVKLLGKAICFSNQNHVDILIEKADDSIFIQYNAQLLGSLWRIIFQSFLWFMSFRQSVECQK